jgi:preprotein translocase subunit SecD
MRAILRVSVLAVVSFSAVLPAWAENPPEKPKLKFEVRRAETKAADGLIEAMVAGKKVYLHKAVAATNEDIATARVVEEVEGGVAIEFTFTRDGAKKMAKLSEQHEGKPVAILIDGQVISAPVLKARISERARITGTFTRQEAEKIVKGLNGS